MRIIHSLFGAGVALTLSAGCASADPGHGSWRFNPAACPDLVEDYYDRRESRRDRRYNAGPLDRLEDRLDARESRRDERVTVCPASAWQWHGPRSAKRYVARPARAAVYYNPYDRRYYRHGPNRVRVNIVVKG